MSNWDKDAYSGKYGNQAISLDRKVGVGLTESEHHDWRGLDVCWITNAEGIVRIYEKGALLALVTPQPALSVDEIAELTATDVGPNAVLSMSTALDECGQPIGGIALHVDGAPVAIGMYDSTGRTEWRRQRAEHQE